jgi:Domain of unknown function (DUF397)
MEERDALRWRKSSFSGNGGGNCVDVAADSEKIYVRNSKNPAGSMVAFTQSEWRAFISGAKNRSSTSTNLASFRSQWLRARPRHPGPARNFC